MQYNTDTTPRKGYKQTKLGWIPEEWNIVSLGDIGTIYTGGTPSTSVKQYWDGKINWFTPTEIVKAGKVLNSSVKKITSEGLDKSSAKLFPKGTIVVCTRATIGDCSIASQRSTTNQGFKNILPNNNVDTNFLYYKLISQKQRFIKLSSGSTFLELSTTSFKKFKIPLPPLQEQQKIAQILNTWDKAIDKQKQLIQAKQKQKKGLMQVLLTGKKRFDGFSKEWEFKEIGEFGEVISGLTYSPNDIREEGILVLRSSNIKNRTLSYNDKVFVRSDMENFTPVKEGDILICVRNGSKSLIGKNTIINEDVSGQAFGAFMSLFRSDRNYYLLHLFDTDMYKKEIHKNLGATINSINTKNLKKFRFRFPQVSEQKKIAQVLSTADKEIKILEQQLEQFTIQKQGLIQQLLTGELRVKI